MHYLQHLLHYLLPMQILKGGGESPAPIPNEFLLLNNSPFLLLNGNNLTLL